MKRQVVSACLRVGVIWSLAGLLMCSGTAFAQRARPVERREQQYPYPPGGRGRIGDALPDWVVYVGMCAVALGAIVGLAYWIRLAYHDRRARDKLVVTLGFCLLGAYVLAAIKYLSPGLAVLAVCGPPTLLGVGLAALGQKKKPRGSGAGMGGEEADPAAAPARPGTTGFSDR